MRKDDLFDLIKSLAPNEKRYFKIYVKQHGEESSPKYLELFDAMDGMKEFDLSELEKRVEDKRILRYLNQEKGYLKNRIMDALRAYRGGKSVDSILYGQMEDLNILYEKGLYGQCLKLLQRTKAQAEAYDRFSVLVAILSLERKLAIELRPQEMFIDLVRIDKEQELALELLGNLVQYQNLWRTLLAVFRQEGYPSELGAVEANPPQVDLSLVSDESKAKSFAALHFLHLAKSLLARMRGDYDETVFQYEKLLAMWRSRKDRIAEAAIQYALVLANYLNMQHKRGEYGAFEEYIAELKDMKLDSFGDRAELFQNTAHLELLLFLNRQLPMGDTSRFREIEQEIKKGLEVYREKVNAARRLVIMHNAMVASFFMEDWDGAIKWWVRIDQDNDVKHVRREIFDFSRIMQLVLQYEKGDYEWLHNLSRNHKRSLERGERMSEFFAIVLNGTYRMSRSDDPIVHRAALAEMNKDLEDVLKVIDGRNILGSREIQHWLLWKISGTGRLYEQLPKR